MKLLYTAIFLPMLGLLVAGCTSNTALQSSETDDLYYASSDKTTRVEYAAPASTSGSQTNATDEVVNPDYASGTASGQTSITNNYNYYDDDYGVSRRNRTYRNSSFYSYDPFYSPYGYSAAYCYNLYDPFWYPYCYPSPGISISIGYGYGYPAYGYGFYDRPYGYYGYNRHYGYGYGGYYQGFYDGYYAGNGYGYGYNNRRSAVNYAPRRDRASTPSNVPSNNVNSGRPAIPNRQANPNMPNSPGTPGGRPMRTGTQPQNPQPNRIEGTPANEVRPAGRPQRDMQNVRPENYQFQQGQQLPTTPDNSRPARGRDADRPILQNNTVAPEAAPTQPERPVRRDRSESRPNFQNRQETAPSVPQQQPAQENYRRPERESRPSRSNDGGSFNQPSFERSAPSGGNSQPGGNMGRPRR